MRAALKAACKAAPRRSRPSPPAASALRQAVLRCPGELAGLRDRAILLLLANDLARDAVVGLQAEHVRWHEDRIDLGRLPALSRAARHDLCPARALEAWLRAAAIRYGPVFRKVTR